MSVPPIENIVKLPFSFDCRSELGLAEQLADGFARAIRDGLYSPGDILPPIKALATSLDVSEITVRRAPTRPVAGTARSVWNGWSSPS